MKNTEKVKLNLGTILKLSDDKFEGAHPNDINKDYSQRGLFYEFPTPNECFYIGSLRTSPVTEIVETDEDKIIFKTLNSTYKLTLEKINLEDNDDEGGN